MARVVRDDKEPGREPRRSICRVASPGALCPRLVPRPDLVISGGALGFDQYLGVAAIEVGIPLLLALPCDPWGNHWPETSLGSKLHRYLVKKATHVHYVTPGPYRLLGPRCLQVRNEWMVDNATDLLACWDGSSGGTANCVEYALQQHDHTGLIIHRMWDPDYKQPILQVA